MSQYRISHDSLGEVKVPREFLYGPQTQRAVENFPISGLRLPRSFIWAQGVIKGCAAAVHKDLGLLEDAKADAVIRAAREVREGKWDRHFVVDVYQAGAGTSQNMNANEVIANRACEILGRERGDLSAVHPNDDVNRGQSTNDTIHVAIHLAALRQWRHGLQEALAETEAVLREKAQAWDGIVKAGRTHLQDAVPIRMGQVFGGYAAMAAYHRENLDRLAQDLLAVGIGGTAVGTGLNAHPEYHDRMVRAMAEMTGFALQSPPDMFFFMQNLEAVVNFSGGLRALAVGLGKLASDLRLLSSGPRTGLAELRLPPVQPGSSIMPGKVNPVMAEMLNMICFQVIGNDAVVAACGQAGQLELNVMMPVMAYNLLHAMTILEKGLRAFNARCLKEMEVNEERCQQLVEQSLAFGTVLNPLIGYDLAAELTKKAYQEGKTLRQVIAEAGVLTPEEMEEVLDGRRMTGK